MDVVASINALMKLLDEKKKRFSIVLPLGLGPNQLGVSIDDTIF